MNRKVLSIKTHTSLHVGAIGDLGDYLPSPKRTLNLNMTATEIGVIVEVSAAGPADRVTAPTIVLVPYGNLKQVVLAPEPLKPVESNKVNAA